MLKCQHVDRSWGTKPVEILTIKFTRVKLICKLGSSKLK
jgi:hypothetical protein